MFHQRSVGAAAVAAVAVMLGAGSLLTASAAETQASVFVPIAPVRVLDTRLGAGLPDELVSAQPESLDVTGSITVVEPGDQIGTATAVPDGATGIVANVTAIAPSTIGFVSLRPGDAGGEPTTSNINLTTVGGIVPNAVTVALPTAGPATGNVQLWFQGTDPTATVHLLVDVVGYYVVGDGGATGPAGPPGPAGATNRLTDHQIATLQWWNDPGAAGAYPVGSFPEAVAFDGNSIWVTNADADTVSKVDRASGAHTDHPVGDVPTGIAFDGNHLWVANNGDNTISKIDPTTGTNLGDHPTGNGPFGIAFDGTHLWVAEYHDDTISKVDPATGAILDTCPTDSGPYLLSYDGSHLWVTNFDDDTVSKINPSTCAKNDYPTGDGPYGIAFDGTDIWVANRYAGTLTRVNRSFGTEAHYPSGTGARGVAYDGTHLWVTNRGDDTVSKFNPATGTLIDSYPTGDGPVGVAFDGVNIWVVNAADSTVSKLVAG